MWWLAFAIPTLLRPQERQRQENHWKPAGQLAWSMQGYKDWRDMCLVKVQWEDQLLKAVLWPLHTHWQTHTHIHNNNNNSSSSSIKKDWLYMQKRKKKLQISKPTLRYTGMCLQNTCPGNICSKEVNNWDDYAISVHSHLENFSKLWRWGIVD